MLRSSRLLMFCASPQTAARESCCEWCWAKPRALPEAVPYSRCGRRRSGFTALLLRRKYLLWRCALVCERLIHSLVIEKKIPPMALCAGL